MRDTTTLTTTVISPPPGVRNFGFSICALCLLRDVEKETHKHKVLWEKYFSVPQIGFGRGATENDYIFLHEILQILMITTRVFMRNQVQNFQILISRLRR